MRTRKVTRLLALKSGTLKRAPKNSSNIKIIKVLKEKYLHATKGWRFIKL